MAESGINSQDHFAKQRRNLILISLIIIFYQAGDLVIKKISFLGNETEIGNPEIVHFSLAVFFVYFLSRYYVACRAVSGVRQFRQSCMVAFKSRCTKEISRMCIKHNLTHTGGIDFQKIGLVNVSLRFRPNEGFDLEAHGSDLLAKIEKGEHKEFIITYGIKYWPRRIYSAIYSIFNYQYFLEYVFPYFIGLLAVLELMGFNLVESIVLAGVVNSAE